MISRGKIICTAFANGKIHDFQLFKNSQLPLSKNTVVIADTGYLGIERIHRYCLIPKKTSKLHKLSKQDKAYNRAVAKIRIEVEHVIRMIKRFSIFAERFRCRRKNFTKRFNLVCAICNFNF